MSNLSQKLKNSLTYSFLDKYIGYVLRFISTIIVARLLTPEEIGIYSVAFVLISVGHVLRDFGVAQYLIQEKELNATKIKAAFATMFFIAWSLWLILFVFKGQFANFYNEPKLNNAVAILSIIFLLAPFGSIRIALLRRDMQFKSLAKINVFSYTSLFIVTIGLCYQGQSYMALVWGQLAGVLATILGCLLVCKNKYWYWPGFKGIPDVFKFGINITTANIAENTAEGAPDLFIGKLLNMQAVGLFSRAQGCVSLFRIFVTASVWPVILPYFSMKNREDGEILPDYLKAIEIYSVFAWPFFISLLILAEPVVLLLYGYQWVASIQIVKVLSIAALFEACFPFRNALLVAIGHARLNLKLQLIVSGLRIAAILIGCFKGLIFAAVGLCLAEFFSQFMIYLGLKTVLPFKFKLWYQHIVKSLVICLLMGLSSFACLQLGLTIDLAHWQMVGLALSLGLAVWLISLSLLKHPIYAQIQQIFQRIRHVQGKIREGSL